MKGYLGTKLYKESQKFKYKTKWGMFWATDGMLEKKCSSPPIHGFTFQGFSYPQSTTVQKN